MSVAVVTSLARGLLRRQIRRGSEHGSVLCQPRQLGGPRDPEVGDLQDVVLANEKVRRLDVAMDEAGIVRVLQPGARLQRERHGFGVRAAFRARRPCRRGRTP